MIAKRTIAASAARRTGYCVLTLALGAGCTNEPGGASDSEAALEVSSALVSPAPKVLALGDSLTFGAHMLGDLTPAAQLTEGYVDEYTETLTRAVGVTNYGCPGETSTTFVNGGCPFKGPLHNPFTGAQLTAAQSYLSSNYPWGAVLLSVGGNDLQNLVYGCTTRTAGLNPFCVNSGLAAALQTFGANLTTILTGLHQSAPSAIVVVLDLYNPLRNGGALDALSDGWVGQFNAAITSAVASANEVAGSRVAVADVFTTFKAAFSPTGPQLIVAGDVHPTDLGYQLIAAQVAAATVQVKTGSVSIPLVQIDCGSTAAVPPYVADPTTGAVASHQKAAIVTAGLRNPAPATVYQTARLSTGAAVTYTLTGFGAGSSNNVRLHFAETYFAKANSRTFDVSINGTTKLRGFDIYKTAGAMNRAVVEEWILPADASGRYVIKLTPKINNVLIAGVEVESAGSCIEGQSCSAGGGCANAVTVCTNGLPSCVCSPVVVSGGLVVASQSSPVSGVVASVRDFNANAVAQNLTANITWGDGGSSTGTVTQAAPGAFLVSGSHIYGAVPKPFGESLVTVTVTDKSSTTTASGYAAATVQSPVVVGPVPVPAPSSLPTSPVAGPDGNVWFLEPYDSANNVGRLSLATSAITEFPNPVWPGGAQSMTVADGNLWFVEFSNSGIASVTTQGTFTTLPTPTTVNPQRIAAGPGDHKVWFSNESEASIRSLSTTTLQFIDDVTIPSGSNALGITAGADGNVWFTEPAADIVGSYNPTTHAVSEFHLHPGSNPSAIVAGPDGNLWVTQTSSGEIARLTPAGKLIGEFALPNPSSGPEYITVGPDSALWFTESQASAIGRITLTGALTEFPVPGTTPTGITQGPRDGRVWFTDSAGNQLVAITP